MAYNDDRDLNIKIGADLTKFRQQMAGAMNGVNIAPKGMNVEAMDKVAKATKVIADQMRIAGVAATQLNTNGQNVAKSYENAAKAVRKSVAAISGEQKKLGTGMDDYLDQINEMDKAWTAVQRKMRIGPASKMVSNGPVGYDTMTYNIQKNIAASNAMFSDYLNRVSAQQNSQKLLGSGAMLMPSDAMNKERNGWTWSFTKKIIPYQSPNGQAANYAADGGSSGYYGGSYSYFEPNVLGKAVGVLSNKFHKVFGENGIIGRWADEMAKDQTIRGLYRLRDTSYQMSGFAYGVTGGVSMPAAAALGGMAYTGANYQQSMKVLEVNLADNFKNADGGATQLSGIMDQLGSKAQSLSQTGIFAPDQIVDAMTAYVRMGRSYEETMNAIIPITQLASIENLDLAQSAYYVSTMMMAFKRDASETADVAAVLAKASADSALTVQQLGHNMGFAASSARLVGWSLEETAAAMETMSSMGIPIQRIGVYIRGITDTLMDLYSNSRQRNLLKSIGIQGIDRATGQVQDFATILDQMSASRERLGAYLNENGEMVNPRGYAKFVSVMSQVFPREQVTAMMGALDAQVKVNETMANEVVNGQKLLNIKDKLGNSVATYKVGETISAGDLQRYYEMQNFNADQSVLDLMGSDVWVTAKGNVLKLANSLKVLAINIAQSGLLDAISKTAVVLANMTNKLNEMVKANPKIGQLITVLLGIAVVIGPIMIATAMLARFANNLMLIYTMYTKLNTVMGGSVGILKFAGSLAKVLVGVMDIISVVGLLVLAYDHLNNVSEKYAAENNSRWSDVISVMSPVMDAVNWLVDKLGALMNIFGSLADFVLTAINASFIAPLMTVLDLVTGIIAAIEGKADVSQRRMEQFKKDINYDQNNGQPLVMQAVNMANPMQNGVWQDYAQRNSGNGLFQFLGDVLPKMASGGVVGKATPLIAGEAGPEAIVPLNSFYAMLRNLLGGSGTAGGSGSGKALSKLLKKALDDAMGSVITFFRNVFKKLFPGLFGKDFGGVFSGIASAIGDAINTMLKSPDLLGNLIMFGERFFMAIFSSDDKTGASELLTKAFQRIMQVVPASMKAAGFDLISLILGNDNIDIMKYIGDIDVSKLSSKLTGSIDVAGLLTGHVDVLSFLAPTDLWGGAVRLSQIAIASFIIQSGIWEFMIITAKSLHELFPTNAGIWEFVTIIPKSVVDLFNGKISIWDLISITGRAVSDLFTGNNSAAQAYTQENINATTQLAMEQAAAGKGSFSTTAITGSLPAKGGSVTSYADAMAVYKSITGTSNLPSMVSNPEAWMRQWIASQGYTVAFANGGVVTKPTRALIGEAGAEAVVPLKDYIGAGSNSTRTANIVVELDGQVIARVVGQKLVDEIRIRTGAGI